MPLINLVYDTEHKALCPVSSLMSICSVLQCTDAVIVEMILDLLVHVSRTAHLMTVSVGILIMEIGQWSASQATP